MEPYHPIAMYKGLLNSSPSPSVFAREQQSPVRERVRSLSCEEKLRFVEIDRSIARHRGPLQRLSEHFTRHREMRAEKEASNQPYAQGRSQTRLNTRNRQSKSVTYTLDSNPNASIAQFGDGAMSPSESDVCHFS